MIKEFLQDIRFRYISPEEDIPPIENIEIAKAFQYANTILPSDEDKLRHSMDLIWKIPKMSTFAIGAVINKIVSFIPEDACYLNIGVWHGFSFFSGIIDNPDKRCIGVDNFSQFGGPRAKFMEEYNKLKNTNTFFTIWTIKSIYLNIAAKK